MVSRVDRILYEKEKTAAAKVLLFPLYLLSLLYGWAVRLRGAFYASHLLKTRSLGCPVLSVGNLTVGGTGKTPLVIALAEQLKAAGIPVAILSRGYKGKTISGPVVSDGETIFLSPKEAGDEAYLMASRLKGTPVLVGKDRFTNGRIALQRFGVRGLLLDDGFQHLQLHRDLNIVLIDSTVGFGDHQLLPRGILREPLAHLRRADLFILTKVEALETCQPLQALLQKIHPHAPIFHSHYEASCLVDAEGNCEGLDFFTGKKVVALSGIANPLSFLSLLKKSGMEVIKEVILPDHYSYKKGDVPFLKREAKEADWILTTEKDLVRLKDLGAEDLPIRAIRALRIEMRVHEEAFFQEVMSFF